MRLKSILDFDNPREPAAVLYQLLLEREPEVNISHKVIPTFEQHLEYVKLNPYLAWYIIEGAHDKQVGAVYLTRQREIGVFVLKAHRRIGYGEFAVKEIMTRWKGEPFLANIAPNNKASIAFFAGLGAKKIQETYELA